MGDENALRRHADNPRVARYMRERFPSPYTMDDARNWIALNAAKATPTNFAIDVNGEPVGGIGIDLRSDIARKSAEIGYWLGEAYWGKGIVTAALRAMSEYAFGTFELYRLEAHVMAPNIGSLRALEKCGYTKEGTLRSSAVKNGMIYDQVMYALVRPPAT